jgi:pimeloyl-ACP methyl ester carboxylesterase
MLRPLIILFVISLLLYVAYVAYFYLNQRTIIFPRHFIAVPSSVPSVPGMQTLWLETSVGRVEAWYLAPLRDELGTPAPLLLLAHGNGDLIDYWLPSVTGLREQGIGVFLVEYPGYGRSQGAPTYAAIRETFLLAYDTIIQHPQVDPARIILFGHSIGGGATTTIAAERPSSGMILLSSFASIRALARERWLPTLAVQDPFDNLAVVQTYPHPILLIHGRRDQTIPHQHSLALDAAAPQSELWLRDCGHNGCITDWDQFWRDLRPFFVRTGVVPPE